MTETNPWADQWLKAQQQFVSAWSDMAKQGSGQIPASQANLWEQSFDLWRKACGGSPQPEMQQALNQCFEMGKGYFTMAEQIGKSIANGSNPTEAAMQWFEQITASMKQMGGQWSMGGAPSELEGMMKQWFAPSQSWQQMVSAMAPMQQSNWQMPGLDSSDMGMGGPMDAMAKLLSSPGIGYFRESQEKQQKGMQLALDYQQSNFKFNQALMQVSIKSLEDFMQRLSGPGSSNSAGSLRELYDQWINTSEEHYAVFALSEDYQTLYGDLVNRLMLLKKHYSGVADDLLKSMNLPTRSEVDTMQQRLHLLRRENLELKKEICDIKSMIDAIHPAKQAERPKQPATKKAAATAKAASKKKAARGQVSKGNKTRTAKAKSGA